MLFGLNEFGEFEYIGHIATIRHVTYTPTLFPYRVHTTYVRPEDREYVPDGWYWQGVRDTTVKVVCPD